MAEIKVPELAESITEATIAKWLKRVGDSVQKGEYLVELETDKVNVEIISDFNGVLGELVYEEGDTVKVGETIAVVKEGEAIIANASTEPIALPPIEKQEQEIEAVDQPSQVPVREESRETPIKHPRPIASPAARKLARQKGINLSEVQAVDPLGRIRPMDIKEPNQNRSQPERQHPVLENAHPERQVERVRMTRRRQTIADRLVEVQQTAAMLTTFNEVDMTNLLALRKKRKDKFFEDNDVKLGFMSFFTKAAVAALKRNPLLNAEIQGSEILIKKYYDIGIAVSAPDGLVVPVVRDADRKNFAEIEKDIFTLAEKARSNKLALSDLQGGTFTITNGGVFGSLMSTPILNGPQVGILGMHKVQLRPVAMDEVRMENRPMMYIALSYDHRIVDGREAVTFLAKVKELIEDPEALLFEA